MEGKEEKKYFEEMKKRLIGRKRERECVRKVEKDGREKVARTILVQSRREEYPHYANCACPGGT